MWSIKMGGHFECVSCMFFVDWELKGQKRIKDFLSKNLLDSVTRNKQLFGPNIDRAVLHSKQMKTV